MRLALDVPVSDEFDAEAARLIDARLPSRLQQQDAELFDGAEDAAERMGWVDLPHRAEDLLARIEALRADLRQRGRRAISLAGVGGSSLAPEVMAATAGVRLEVVDSTDPDQIVEAIGTDLSNTVLGVASKPGPTVETDAIRRSVAAAGEWAGSGAPSRMSRHNDP